MNFLATIGGGIEPDEWNTEVELFAVDFLDAAQQADNIAKDAGGVVISLSQS